MVLDAGAKDADDSFNDSSSDGMGRAELTGYPSKGELTQANKAANASADVDIYELVADLSSPETSLANDEYFVTISSTDWDLVNTSDGGIASFKIWDSNETEVAAENTYAASTADTLNFNADGSSSYFVEITGDGLGDAQYEIIFDVV